MTRPDWTPRDQQVRHRSVNVAAGYIVTIISRRSGVPCSEMETGFRLQECDDAGDSVL